MIKRNTLLLILFGSFLLPVLPASAQKQSYNWYFGAEAGISFSSGTATPIYDGHTDATEGVATISDKDGNLLFYTDGIQVWNRNHVIMQRGGHLNGHRSSTQSGIIVPQPGNDSLYYIFTVDAFEGIKGLNYNIVNMKKDNGLGDVINFPVQLLTPTFEKVTAVKHCNNTDIWIITRASQGQAYYAWLLTAGGLSPSPVISSTNNFPGHYIGYLKASPDAKKLVSVNYDSCTELSDFNNTTGVVSNTLLIAKRPPVAGTDNAGVYGAEFSPDNKQLYISTFYALGINRPSWASVEQYDIQVHDSATIANSRLTITSDAGIHSALQLGPDNKIYIADNVSHYLSRINNPNARGTGAGIELNAVYLGSRAVCYSGLPTFIQSLFNPLYGGYNFSATDNCNNLLKNFSVNDPSYLDSLKWDFGDPVSGTSNFSKSFSPSHLYSNPGRYTVKLIVYINSPCIRRSDTIRNDITVIPYPFSLGADKSFCKESSASLPLDASTPGATAYLWSTGAITPVINVTQSGTYWCKVSVSSCEYSDTILVLKDSLPDFSLPATASICNSQPVILQPAVQPNWQLLWQDGSRQVPYLAYYPGIYSLSAANACGTTRKETEVKRGICSIYVPNAFTPNSDGLNSSFKILGTEKVTEFHLQVFNRYGQVVFESRDKNEGWTGQLSNGPAQQGTYIYVLTYKDGAGRPAETISGSFVLIR